MYNNTVISFYFFDCLSSLLFIYKYIYIFLDCIYVYYSIIYLPLNYDMLFNNLNLITNKFMETKIEYNNLNWYILHILREKELQFDIDPNYLLEIILFEITDYLYMIFGYILEKLILNFNIVINYYYYYFFIKLVHFFYNIFWSYKFLMGFRYDQYLFIVSNVYFHSYINFYKIILYNYFIIDIPFYFIQPFLKFFIYLYEYFISIKYLFIQDYVNNLYILYDILYILYKNLYIYIFYHIYILNKIY